jgi:hypothetical protein
MTILEGMEHLSASQQEAVQQLQGILGSHDHDVDVLISVLQSLEWNIEVKSYHWMESALQCNSHWAAGCDWATPERSAGG